MSRRRLKPEELDLWNQVARTTERLAPSKAMTITDVPEQITPKHAPEPKRRIEPFSLGAQSARGETRDIAPDLREGLRKAPVRMDAKSYKTMQRGKLKPEARIDLHGMTIAQAHPALVSFVLSSHAAGRRLVLVITGKGGRRDDPSSFAPQRMGALKRQVPHWLTMQPCANIVMQVTEAHLRHGGGGAYYVYLRRAR